MSCAQHDVDRINVTPKRQCVWPFAVQPGVVPQQRSVGLLLGDAGDSAREVAARTQLLQDIAHALAALLVKRIEGLQLLIHQSLCCDVMCESITMTCTCQQLRPPVDHCAVQAVWTCADCVCPSEKRAWDTLCD